MQLIFRETSKLLPPNLDFLWQAFKQSYQQIARKSVKSGL